MGYPYNAPTIHQVLLPAQTKLVYACHWERVPTASGDRVCTRNVKNVFVVSRSQPVHGQVCMPMEFPT